MQKLRLAALIGALLIASLQIIPCKADPELIWQPSFETEGMESTIADKLTRWKRWGFINKSGNFVIAPKYDLVKSFEDGSTTVGIGDHYFKLDKSGAIISPDMTRIEVIKQANEKRWARDAKEKAKNEQRPKYAGDIFDSTGTKRLGPASLFKIGNFSEGMAVCTEPPHKAEDCYGTGMNRTGYINEKGWMKIPQRFFRAEDFHDGFAHVERTEVNGLSAGYVNSSGALLGGHFYNCAWDFINGMAIVRTLDKNEENEEWGFLSRSGNELMGHWTNVSQFSSKIAGVRDVAGLWGFVDKDGKKVLPNLYKNVHYEFNEGLTFVQTENGYGYVDENGQIVIAPKFADVGNFSNGLAPAAVAPSDSEKMTQLSTLQNWRCEFINRSGEKIGGQYFAARHFSEGLAAVRTGLKWGFIDQAGTLVISANFDDARSFSNGLAAVLVGDRWGFIDRTGNFKIQPKFLLKGFNSQYKYCPHQFLEGVVLADAPDYFWRFYDEDGKEALHLPVSLPMSYDSGTGDFADGLAAVQGKSFGQFGYIDRTGKFQIPPKLESAKNFSEEIAAVSVRSDKRPLKDLEHYTPSPYCADPSTKKFGFIDKNGTFLGQPEFDEVRSFHEGFAAVALGKYVLLSEGPANTLRISKKPPGPKLQAKWGFIDRSGQRAIDFQFDAAKDFSEGLAPVLLKTKWGFINRGGKLEIEPQFEFASPFSNDLAVVSINGRFGFIDHRGAFVIPPKYSLAGSFSQDRALIINLLDSQTHVSTKDHINSEPIESNDDMLKFLIEHVTPPDADEWAGFDH
ncbi:MAG: WG repeat-containing protein [Candidatus Obscuribacterales bacterium]|nr:WG repeat-containing protein [Candidatus Obscuribacterales bacterium]